MVLMSGLLLLVATFANLPQWHGGFDYARRGIFQVGVCAFVGLALWWSVRRSEAIWWSPMATGFAAFIGLGMVSLVSSAERLVSVQIIVHWFACGVFAYLLVLMVKSSRERHQLFVVLSLVAVGVSGIGLLQVFAGFDGILDVAPPGSIFGFRNISAQAVSIGLPALLALLLSARGKFVRSLLTLCLGLCGSYLVFTGTRTVWLASLAQATVLAALVFRNRRSPVFGQIFSTANLVSLVGAAAFVVGLSVARPSALLEQKLSAPIGIESAAMGDSRTVQLDESASGRVAAYENTFQLIKAHPWLGMGAATFGHRLPDTAPLNHQALFIDFFHGWNHAHSDWLQLWAELGCGFPVLIAFMVVTLVRRRPSFASPTLPAAGVYFAPFNYAALAGFSVNMAIDFPVYNAIPPVLMAVHCAMLERHGLEQGWTGSRWFAWPAWSKWRVCLAAGVLAVGFVGLVDFQRRLFRGEELRIEAMKAQRNEAWAQMAEVAEQGARVLPGRSDWLDFLGQANFQLALSVEGRRSTLPEYFSYLEAAAGYLQRHQAIRPNAYGEYLLGQIRVRQKQLPLADEAYTKALRLFPTSADVVWERARVRNLRGDLDGAIVDFREFSRLRPESALKADLIRAQLLVAAKRPGEAVAVLEPLARDQKSGLESRLALGRLLLTFPDRKAEGVRLLQEALSDPRTPQITKDRIKNAIGELNGVSP